MDIWNQLYGEVMTKTTTGKAPTSKGWEAAPAKFDLADKLSKAGLAAHKPSLATLQKVQPILVAAMPAEDACLLGAWLGGAHDRADGDFLFVDTGLTAQTACGISQWAQAAGGWAYRSVDEVLADLAAAGHKDAADLIKTAGKSTAKQSAKKQTEEANKDAKKLAKDALGAVTPDGFGSSISLGAGVAVAAVVVVVAWKLLR